MHWNYRIAQFEDKKGNKTFKLIEAVYGEDNKKKTFDKVTDWSEASELEAETLEELKEDIMFRAQALERPILKMKSKIKVEPSKSITPVYEMGS